MNHDRECPCTTGRALGGTVLDGRHGPECDREPKRGLNPPSSLLDLLTLPARLYVQFELSHLCKDSGKG